MPRPTLTAVCSLLALLSLAGCRWSDSSRHQSRFITVNGVRLNYLDWGGTGPVLIFIHGLGDNPHIFDDLAPAFTDHFHVIAYARRGHGDSEATGPYDLGTLTADLCGLMDALGIAKADLIGWSMGGDEVTAMAGEHPGRVDRIIYLDAAYDWADPAFVAAFRALPPIYLSPPAVAFTSLEAYRAYERTTWFPGVSTMRPLEAWLRDSVTVEADGRVKSRMPGDAAEALTTTLLTAPRDYTKVHAPALAIFAETMLDLRHGAPEPLEANRGWEQKYMIPFRAASIERIRRELAGVEIVTVPGTHMDFVFTSRRDVVAVMRRFLGVRDLYPLADLIPPGRGGFGKVPDDGATGWLVGTALAVLIILKRTTAGRRP